MQKKLIEQIPCITKNSRKKEGINVNAKIVELKGEKTLIVDMAGKRPLVRTCIDGKHYITYFFEDIVNHRNYTNATYKKGFSTATIHNICGYYSSPLSLYHVSINEEAEKNIMAFMGEKKRTGYSYHSNPEWFDALRDFEEKITTEKNNKAWQKAINKRQVLIDRDTKCLKPLPRKIEKWAFKLVEQHYLQIAPFYGKDETTAECTNCHSEMVVKKKEILTKCPCCGKKVQMISTKNKLNGNAYHMSKEIILLQKINDSLYQRHFVVERDLVNNYEKYRTWEKGCYVLRQNEELLSYYAKHNPWTGKNFYDDRNLAGMYKIRFEAGTIYPYGDLFKGTDFQYSALDLVGDVDPIHYLYRYKAMPQIEMLAKVGLTTLAKTISAEHMATNYKKPWEMLKVNKEEFNRMRAMNVTLIGLFWFQYENESGNRLDDEDIEWMSDNRIWPYSLEFITSKMSPKKIKNYLIKQSEISHYQARDVVQTWRDYCDMATVAKVNMDLEINYKPANVVAAHDDLANVQEIADREKELLELFPEVNDICSSIVDKYTYKDDNYAIVVPSEIKEIIREGKILGHCLDRSNIYFDRISRKESFIVFLRKTNDLDMPYYTLEIEPDGTTRQKRTTGDKQGEDFKKECIPFIRKWQSVVKRRLTKEDKELANTSAILRDEEFKQLRKDGNKIWHGVLAGQLLADVLEADLMLA